MTPEQEHEYEMTMSDCRQQITLAAMSLHARELLDLGYSGHGRNQYEWQASQTIGHLKSAIRLAEKLPLYSEPSKP
jgi:hypothetical protein